MNINNRLKLAIVLKRLIWLCLSNRHRSCGSTVVAQLAADFAGNVGRRNSYRELILNNVITSSVAKLVMVYALIRMASAPRFTG